MQLEVDFNFDKLFDVFDRLAKATNTTQILDEAGAVILNRIRTRFLAEEDADGSKWPESRAAEKRKGGGYTIRGGKKWRGTGTLFETGTLFRSLQLAGTGPDERKILTDVEYGKYHQYGTKLLPRRVFLAFNQADADLVSTLITRRIEKALK